jgi:hypothetical protein
VTTKPQYTIEKYVNGYAYAKNGNTGNPTPVVWWMARGSDRKIVGMESRKKDIVDLVVNYLDGEVVGPVTLVMAAGVPLSRDLTKWIGKYPDRVVFL